MKKIIILAILISITFQQEEDENELKLNEIPSFNKDEYIDDGFDEDDHKEYTHHNYDEESETTSKVKTNETDNENSNVFQVDISELENEIIPTERVSNPYLKKNKKLNMMIIDTKLQHLSTQISMQQARKTDIFSPNWFTLSPDRSQKQNKLKIDGHDKVLKNLISNIRFENDKALIIPILSCDNNFRFLSDQTGFFSDESVLKLASDLEKRTKHYKIDGFFIDCLDLQVNPEFEDLYYNLIEKVGLLLKNSGKVLILNIYPYSEKIVHFLTREKIQYLSKFVNYFVLSTIEYNRFTKKPVDFYNSPIFWIKQSINYYTGIEEINKNNNLSKDMYDNFSDEIKIALQKFIIKVPFFGVSYELREGEKAKITQINSSGFMSLCLKGKKEGVLKHKWDNYGKEHLIHILNEKGDYYLSYPTRKFLQERVKLVEEIGLAGIVVDEITRGFEDFMDSL